MRRGPLSLEKYHSFVVDPWDTPATICNLNHILHMHGFIKLHRDTKDRIMQYLVGQVDLQPPRRSTLHRAALSAAAPPSAAVITTAQARADVEAIGWAECPVGCVAAFAAQAADPPEAVERVPRPADFVLAGRRPRSKRTRSSAYKRKRGDSAAFTKVKVRASQEKVAVTVEEEKRELSPPPTPPPRWMRSPTPPPPPPSPQPPSSLPPLPPQDDVAPPPPPCRAQPTLAPLPAPPCWGSPSVRPSHPPQLYWGLPLPTPDPGTLLPGPPPGWASPTVPSCYPAPFWGAPGVLPPLSPRVHWGWPPALPAAARDQHVVANSAPAHAPPASIISRAFPRAAATSCSASDATTSLQLRRPPPHLQGQLSLPPPLPHLLGPPPGFFLMQAFVTGSSSLSARRYPSKPYPRSSLHHDLA